LLFFSILSDWQSSFEKTPKPDYCFHSFKALYYYNVHNDILLCRIWKELLNK
jgi:hypothetical protein